MLKAAHHCAAFFFETMGKQDRDPVPILLPA
jgi:hypothetical protein